MARVALLVLSLVCSALVAAPAEGAKLRRGPAGAAFYTAPSPLPGKKHGDLIWWRKARGTDALEDARSNRLVLYRSKGAGGTVAVSGSVAIPKGKAPKGGWPVITWAHGTTGIADICAPTRDGRLTTYIHPLLNSWLKRGWAVVRTDYEGLGTPAQTHPFLIGRAEGGGVLDIVRAARKLDRRIGRRVVISGHSQGGHAALFATQMASSYTKELKVRGTAAFAPATHLSEQLPALTALPDPNPSLSSFAIMILRGLDLARPSLNVQGALSEIAAARYGQLDERCLEGLREPGSFGDVPPGDILKEYTDLAPFVSAADELIDPENLTIRTPVRIDQGTSDTTVLPGFTTQTVTAYEERGTDVTYERYSGASHTNVVDVGASKATAWIKRRLR